MSKREKTVADGHVTTKHVTHHEPLREEKKHEDVPEAAAGSKRKAEEDPEKPVVTLTRPLNEGELLAIVTRALQHVPRKAAARGGARASGPAGVVSAH